MTNAIPTKITAVQDRLNLTVREAKKLLGMDLDDDSNNAMIELSIETAKQAADEYLNNPFWQLAELYFDDTANWGGNRTSSDLENEGDGTSDDIIRNNSRSASACDSRLDHSVPDMWAYPRVELPIPDPVKMGVVKFVELIVQGQPEGVSEEKIGDWQVRYLNYATRPDRAMFIKGTFWDQYLLLVGL